MTLIPEHDKNLHRLPASVDGWQPPELFTYPFRYIPHPLCVAAAEDVMPRCRELLKEEKGGKMFGVMVVEGKNGKLWYLVAFSGMLGGRYLHEGFVPPVYNLQEEGSYFKREEAEISRINERIRKGEDTEELRRERKERSVALQQWLFEQFDMLDAEGNEMNLVKIFEKVPGIMSAEEFFNRRRDGEKRAGASRIPSGAGECCAPKLLQYAYKNGLKPLCMAEFWLGPSPKDELRVDGNYYPACSSKCKPILRHMLHGLRVEENPMLRIAREKAKEIKYVYEDENMVVVDKPGGLPTAPGKEDMPSLLEIVRQKYPTAVNVHRLDMDTEGLVVLALNENTYKELQGKFVRHEVKKTYVAVLEHPLAADKPRSGVIDLPLLPNPYDRPRQMVDKVHGKRAITRYEMVSDTKVLFYPETGRTHQLRVHAAHPEGLGVAIKGDALYGKGGDKLWLRAEKVEF